jgi:hypothetical protein
MSQTQAKAARRKMRNGYAHMGGSLRRPTVAGLSYKSVAESIADARSAASREAKRKSTKKAK